MRKRLPLFASILLLTQVAAAHAAEPSATQPAPPKPAELAKLIRESRARLRSLELVELKAVDRIVQRSENGQPVTKPCRRSRATLTWTPDRSLVEEVSTETGADGTESTSTLTILIEPGSTTHLRRPSQVKKPQAVVMLPGPGQSGDVDVRKAGWAPANIDVVEALEKPAADIVITHRDDKVWNVVIPINPRLVMELSIDHERGMTPLAADVRNPRGAYHERFEFFDLRELAPGVWLPHRYTFDDNDMYHGEYRVEKASANLPIPAEKLKLNFPNGTVVDDQVGKRRYEVGTKE